jgi:hypothetical protein
MDTRSRIASGAFLVVGAFLFFAMAPLNAKEQPNRAERFPAPSPARTFDFGHTDLSTPAELTTFAVQILALGRSPANTG